MPTTAIAGPRRRSVSSLGVPTDVVACEYDDRIAVFVSQDGRLGTVLLVARQSSGGTASASVNSALNSTVAMGSLSPDTSRSPEALPGGLQPGSTAEGELEDFEELDPEGWRPGEAAKGQEVYSVSVLLGRRDEPLLVACARSLAESLGKLGVSKPLLLAVGLKAEHHSVEGLRDISKQVAAVLAQQLM